MVDKFKKLKNEQLKTIIIFIIICLFIIFLINQIDIKYLFDNQSGSKKHLMASNSTTIINNTENSQNSMNVNSVGETTVTRIEERDKLVSKDYWDWWTPVSFQITETSANLSIEKPNLEIKKSVISKTGSENLVFAGEELTYEITITNKGTKTEKNIEISDKIPQNTTFCLLMKKMKNNYQNRY